MTVNGLLQIKVLNQTIAGSLAHSYGLWPVVDQPLDRGCQGAGFTRWYDPARLTRYYQFRASAGPGDDGRQPQGHRFNDGFRQAFSSQRAHRG